MRTRGRRLLVVGTPETNVLIAEAVETGIEPSVALFAETLWDPRREAAELIRAAASSYHRG